MQTVLFGSARFFQLHFDANRGDVWISDGACPIGFLQLNVGQYLHPGRGSYGHGWSIDQIESIPLITETIQSQDHFHSAIISLPPTLLLASPLHVVAHAFRQSGWKIASAIPSYFILTQRAFLEHVDYGNRKRIQNVRASGAVFEKYTGSDFRVYWDVIYANRISKGYALSMQYEDVHTMHTTFQHQSFWCGVRDSSDKLIAAAWVLQPMDTVWQVVYWGHAPEAEILSPVSYMAEQLHAMGTADGITYIDLGTAEIDGKPNPGLIRYKLNLGAIASLKFTFILEKR